MRSRLRLRRRRTIPDRRRVIGGRLGTLHGSMAALRTVAGRDETPDEKRRKLEVRHDALVWAVGILYELEARGILAEVEWAAKQRRDADGRLETIYKRPVRRDAAA